MDWRVAALGTGLFFGVVGLSALLWASSWLCALPGSRLPRRAHWAAPALRRLRAANVVLLPRALPWVIAFVALLILGYMGTREVRGSL